MWLLTRWVHGLVWQQKMEEDLGVLTAEAGALDGVEIGDDLQVHLGWEGCECNGLSGLRRVV